jgi:carboxypeptidase C (cathepsin A)
MIRLVQEHGPCRITNDSSGVTLNPFSWSNEASVLYTGRPVGVGFSHGTLNVGTSQQAASDIGPLCRFQIFEVSAEQPWDLDGIVGYFETMNIFVY